MLIDRPTARGRIREAFSLHPVVALTGPRQCGKTTLARAVAADAPGTTRSMRAAMHDLGLAHLYVVYPGEQAYSLDEGISVLPMRDVPALASSLGEGEGRAGPIA